MNFTGLTIITIIGAIMAVIGAAYWIIRLVNYRQTQRDLDRSQTGNPESESNTFASFWLANGLLHIGMLLLTLGGVGLIVFGLR